RPAAVVAWCGEATEPSGDNSHARGGEKRADSQHLHHPFPASIAQAVYAAAERRRLWPRSGGKERPRVMLRCGRVGKHGCGRLKRACSKGLLFPCLSSLEGSPFAIRPKVNWGLAVPTMNHFTLYAVECCCGL
ncbi:unnamed protein product, partial [Urochloa humidicola]